jgi:hypothetical protein
MKVIDSTKPGNPELKHSVYAIVYTPSWFRIRSQFDWKTTAGVFSSLSIMKEYFTSALVQERPIRAERCLLSLKSFRLYSHRRDGTAMYSTTSREMIQDHIDSLAEYLANNPVVAWDWVVSWTECRAMAEAFPDELLKLFRRLRSVRDSKKKPKKELAYFLEIIRTVARENQIDLEHKKWQN